MKSLDLRASWLRVRRSAMFFGVAATAIRVGANFALLPLLVTKLPTSELALWWVFLALGGFANLADFGFGATIARVYSFLWAGADDFDAEGLRPPSQHGEPNLPHIRQLSETVRVFYWLLAGGALILLSLVGTFVLIKPVAAIANPRHVWVAWAAYLVTIGYNLATSRWPLACQGLGQVREMQASYAWSGIAYVICAGGLLMAGWGLAALVVATFVRGFLLREYCRRVYYTSVPKLPGARMKPNMDMLKRLWPNASKLGVLSVGGFFLSNGSVLISSHFLGEQVTASFGLTAQIGAFLMSFAGLWLTVKWPELTMLRTQGRLQAMAVLFARRLAFTMGTFIVLALVVVWAGNRLLAWKGTHTQLLPNAALLFYFAYLAQQLFYVQFGSLTYTENVVPFFKIGIFTGLAMLALSFVMTSTFGLWGMLIAPLIAESVCSSWYTVWRGLRGQPLTPRQFLHAAFTGHL